MIDATNDTRLQDRIREAGMRVTAPRLAVLRHLAAQPTPVSHSEIVDGLISWDRATVFRNLVDLTESGLVRRIDVGDHVWRYEYATEGGLPEGHPHFTCISCGEVTCLDGVSVAMTPTLVKPAAPNFVPDLAHVEIHLRGRCVRCA